MTSSRTRQNEQPIHKPQDHAEKEAAADDQQALRKSEEMMKAFLTATGGEVEESNKSERTRTIIKTIKVRTLLLFNPINNKNFIELMFCTAKL